MERQCLIVWQLCSSGGSPQFSIAIAMQHLWGFFAHGLPQPHTPLTRSPAGTGSVPAACGLSDWKDLDSSCCGELFSLAAVLLWRFLLCLSLLPTQQPLHLCYFTLLVPKGSQQGLCLEIEHCRQPGRSIFPPLLMVARRASLEKCSTSPSHN